MMAWRVRLDASVSALDEVALSAKDLGGRSRVSAHACFCRVRRWEFCMGGRPIEGTPLGKNESKRFRCCGAEVGEKDRGQIDWVKGVEWSGVEWERLLIFCAGAGGGSPGNEFGTGTGQSSP
jgi:hypothetical protein